MVLKVVHVPKDNSKKERAKAWIKNRYEDAKCFWAENKDVILTLAPVVVGGVTVMAKVVRKQQAIYQEKKLKDRYVWDAKLGHYWLTNRKLNNAEWTEIERRKNEGESLGEILASMKVLKL